MNTFFTTLMASNITIELFDIVGRIVGQPCLFVVPQQSGFRSTILLLQEFDLGQLLLGKKSMLFDSRHVHEVAAYICCLLRILRAAPPALTPISRGDANAGYIAVSDNRLHHRCTHLYWSYFEPAETNDGNSTTHQQVQVVNICCLLRILRAAPPALTLISRGDANAGYFAVSAKPTSSPQQLVLDLRALPSEREQLHRHLLPQPSPQSCGRHIVAWC